MIVRELIPNDEPSVIEHIVELHDHLAAMDSYVASGVEHAIGYLEYLKGQCMKMQGNIYVAEVDGEIAGMVCVWGRYTSDAADEVQYEYAYISDLFVILSYRGRGIGKALIERAIEHASSLGAALIRLDVLASNLSARALYNKLGFRERVVSMERRIQR